jgi:hypothetical protein
MRRILRPGPPAPESVQVRSAGFLYSIFKQQTCPLAQLADVDVDVEIDVGHAFLLGLV